MYNVERKFFLSTSHNFTLYILHYTFFILSHRIPQLSGIVRGIIARFTIEIPPDIATAVSVTEVKISPDLQYADTYISAISGADAAVGALKKKNGAIRKAIAKEVNAHTVPVLRFHVDTRGAEVDRLDKLIDSL